jgi:hypothetical protein
MIEDEYIKALELGADYVKHVKGHDSDAKLLLKLRDLFKERVPRYNYSIEMLVHFRCSVCSGWWSIGDAKVDRTYFCPHCGKALECGKRV